MPGGGAAVLRAGRPDGVVLPYGRDEEYGDEDTVSISEAFRLVKHIVGTGSWPTDACWVVDR
ncbi:hypothetical protein AQJ58_22465 [Streptomyces sp. DSM 15324]|nr:hypothetical protein AQJ58_22465 [Streptomyces sp. DSM 15324]